MALQLTDRDLEILQVLTRRVRVLSIQQVARTWWPGASETAAENRLKLLAKDEFILLERGPAHPELELSGPVAEWNIGDIDPDVGAIAYRLQSRWKEHPKLTLCASASAKSSQQFGGHGGRMPRTVERTHDIHMAAVFLHYRRCHPELVFGWTFEEKTRKERIRETGRNRPEPGEKLPDVIIQTTTGRKVVEFGGAYGKDKVTSFHNYCKAKGLPYEIW